MSKFIELRLGEVRIHHVCDNERTVRRIRFDCIWRPMKLASSMIKPSEFAKLILNQTPRHSLLKISEMTLWMDAVPCGVQRLGAEAFDHNTILQDLGGLALPNVYNPKGDPQLLCRCCGLPRATKHVLPSSCDQQTQTRSLQKSNHFLCDTMEED